MLEQILLITLIILAIALIAILVKIVWDRMRM